MSLIYPASQLKIMDYNRVLKSLKGLTTDQFMEKLSQYYTINELPDDAPRSPGLKGQSNLYINNKWYSCFVKQELVDTQDPVKSLDTQFMTDYVFDKILGIKNIRTDHDVDFVGGIRGMKELEQRCHTDSIAAFAMHPTLLSEVFAVADKGMIMPPKCTWFEPKPRSGFVVNVFKDS